MDTYGFIIFFKYLSYEIINIFNAKMINYENLK